MPCAGRPRGEDSVTVAIATLPGLLFMKHLSKQSRQETGLWDWAGLGRRLRVVYLQC